MDVHNDFFAYWNALERQPGWIDLGMGMPSPDLFAPLLDFQEAFAQGMRYRADYQPQAGPLAVRRAIAEYEAERTGVLYSPENIMLVSGALRGFSLVLDNLVQAGTRLVEVVPTYPLLAGYARYAAEKFTASIATIIPRDSSQFIIEEDEIKPYIKPSSILYITNPSNPTGLYMPPQTLRQIVNAYEQCQSYVIVDESCDMPLIAPRVSNRRIDSPSLIRICGLSKNILLAGFRAAYIVADTQIIRKLSSYSAFSDANAPTIFNDVICHYLEHPEIAPEVNKLVNRMVHSTIAALKRITNIEQIIDTEACYYIFLKVQYSGGSWKLFQHLLNAGVNVVPGTLFGIDDRKSWIRICCARDTETITEGLSRMKKALTSLDAETDHKLF